MVNDRLMPGPISPPRDALPHASLGICGNSVIR